jgi:YVTN family beta-propeller protein
VYYRDDQTGGGALVGAAADGKKGAGVMILSTTHAITLVLALSASVKSAPPQELRPGTASTNIYAATGNGALAPVALRARPLVYVPNSRSASVTVIDPLTYRVIRTFATGALPQHVVPAYDLETLWVANNEGNSLTPIDPASGQNGTPVRVDDPYNLYFTPDGRFAMVIAERLQRIDFRDAHDMRLVQSLTLKCKGVDHMEFTADGRYGIATCEFSGQLVKIDLERRAVIGYLNLGRTTSNPLKKLTAALFGQRHGNHEAKPMPQDIRSSPDGTVFFVADMTGGGVILVDPIAFTRVGFIATGIGTHGLYPSRDGTRLYITNRGWNTTAGGRHGPGSISVLDFAARQIVAQWPVPGGGSPDMGNVTADGQELWVSGRYDDEVYVFATATGALTHRIPVGREPHGLCVWPQPGRYSLGHTGNMR